MSIPPAFDEYLNDDVEGKYRYRKIALTASSYKNVDHTLTDENVNSELATYGDALLKLALCKTLFEEKVKNITVEKQIYETDEVLVKVIAQHYDLVGKLKFDKDDKEIPQDYNYPKKKKSETTQENTTKNSQKKKGNDCSYKYIATAVEALLAAYYLDFSENFELVRNVVKEWKLLIDKSQSTN